MSIFSLLPPFRMMKIFHTFAVSTRVPNEPILGTNEGKIFLGCLIADPYHHLSISEQFMSSPEANSEAGFFQVIVPTTFRYQT
jgi:hypothetical protein